jgi:hypothetical protein
VAVPFLVAYLKAPNTNRWALIPAGVFVSIGLVAFIGGQQGLTYAGPLAVIVVGILLIYNSNRRKLV